MPKKRTLKALSKELLDTPFFPLLFISEAVKILVLSGLGTHFYLMMGLSIGSVILWVLSDAIDIDEDAIIGES